MRAKFKSLSMVLLKASFIFLALYIVFHKINLEEVLALMANIHPLFFVFAILCSMLSLCVSALRSRAYFAHYGLSIGKAKAMMLYYAGTFLNIVLPGGIGGDGYKIIYLSRHYGLSKLKGFRVVLYERVNGFYILSIIGFVMLYFSSFMEIPYVALINTLLLLAITPCYYIGIKYVLKDEVRIAIRASWYSLIVQLLQVVMAYFVLKSFGFDNAIYVDFILLFIIASILAIIPISIGGVGVRELTLLYGLSLIGMDDVADEGVAFAFSLFVTYVISALPGLWASIKLGLGTPSS